MAIEFGIGSEEGFSVLEVAKMFNGQIEMLPERKGNRMTADVMADKTKALGWSAKRTLKDYIEQLKENNQGWKINYVAYLDPFHFNGGGEMIMNDLLTYAKSIGYEVNITSIRPFKTNYKKDADLTILSDLFNEPTLSEKFDLNFIEKIIASDRYIHFDNSYVDSCDLSYLPCIGENQKKCKQKSIFNIKSNIQRRSFSKKCFQTDSLIQKIYNKSLANIFLSPLHYSKVSKMLNIENNPYFILRPTVGC